MDTYKNFTRSLESVFSTIPHQRTWCKPANGKSIRRSVSRLYLEYNKALNYQNLKI